MPQEREPRDALGLRLPRFRLGWFAGFLVAVLGFAVGHPRAQAEGLKAGVARVDITPTQPVQLAGYASRKDLCGDVHDPLFARALAFERADQRLVLVSVDNLGFYSATAAPLRESILNATGLEPAELMLCAIHTHSAPALTLDDQRGHPNNVAYTRNLQSKLARLVQQALAALEPVELSRASGASPVGVNRREVVRDDEGNAKIVLGRNPDRLTDREVQVLKVSSRTDSGPTAVLFAYATHSTSLGPRNMLISGDIHGLAEQFLETYLGTDVVSLGFAGASGDIDPWVRILPNFRTNRGWIPEPVLMGTMLGQEVARVVEGMEDPVLEGPIRCSLRTLQLPGKTAGEPAAGAEPTVPFTLSVACIGQVAFVGFGGEVFNEIGRTVKSRSPFATTLVFTHCNGAEGYVPTRSSYPEGGYEVRSSPFGPGADQALIEATLELLREIR